MKIDVKKVAKLANLPLNDEELQKFEEQLSETLDYVAQLNEIDTEGINPTSQVTGLENVTREDVTKPSLSQEDVLANTKNKQKGMFVVTSILKD